MKKGTTVILVIAGFVIVGVAIKLGLKRSSQEMDTVSTESLLSDPVSEVFYETDKGLVDQTLSNPSMMDQRNVDSKIGDFPDQHIPEDAVLLSQESNSESLYRYKQGPVPVDQLYFRNNDSSLRSSRPESSGKERHVAALSQVRTRRLEQSK